MIALEINDGTTQLEMFHEDPAAILNTLHRTKNLKATIEVDFIEEPQMQLEGLLEDGVAHVALS